MHTLQFFFFCIFFCPLDSDYSTSHTIWQFNTLINNYTPKHKTLVYFHPCFDTNIGGGQLHSNGVRLYLEMQDACCIISVYESVWCLHTVFICLLQLSILACLPFLYLLVLWTMLNKEPYMIIVETVRQDGWRNNQTLWHPSYHDDVFCILLIICTTAGAYLCQYL